MLTLGEELILVALDTDKGVIRGSQTMQFGLNAAGLADLLAGELITLRQPNGSSGVTLVADADRRHIDDPLLAAVRKQVQSMREGDRHPDRCVRNWLEPSLHVYLKALRNRGVVDWDKPTQPKVRYGRFRLLDTEPAVAARARVDRVTAGAEPDVRDLDLAGIVHGLGLDKAVYGGMRGRLKRAALAGAVDKQRFAVILTRALPMKPGLDFTINAPNNLAEVWAMDGSPGA
ncbi:MAG: GPP34 family phosphoprotein [Catenulispora sp.]